MASATKSIISDDQIADEETRTWKERAMFYRIAQSDAVVKSQQRGENDLTLSEKVEYLSEMFNEYPLKILQRFGNHLNAEDLELFKGSSSDEVQLYVNKLKALYDPVYRNRVIKNRRYNYLKSVLKESDYFDENELEKRNPLLYKQYIGQYITGDEMAKSHQGSVQKFSELLFHKIDKDLNEFRCDLEEMACDEEFDEESDSNDEDEEEFKKYLEEQVPVDSEEKSHLRQVFIGLVENDFLMGDTNFDYSVVDNNEHYDDNINDQDIEDRYFDEEEPSENQNVHITGSDDDIGDYLDDANE